MIGARRFTDDHETRPPEWAPSIGTEATTIVPGPRPPETAPGRPERPRLELFEVLGGGAMGVVHRGHDHALNRHVAVKVLRAEFRDDLEMVLRLRAEAQVGSQLQHPGIPPLYDVGTLPDGRPYFTMKLVRGQTFQQALDAGRTPTDQLLIIFQQIAEAVGYAHGRDVIHRDLKPSNVMVGPHGEVQVMDWGLAKVLRPGPPPIDEEDPGDPPTPHAVATVRSGASEHDSVGGQVLGTYAYMSPEQARGEVDRIDARSDVFALGSILCRVLTGKAAFTGGDPREIWRKAVHCETADALERLDACGADAMLISLARECLEPSPADRPADARAVAERVGDHLASVHERLEQTRRELAVAQVEVIAEQEQRVLLGRLADQERRRRRTAWALAAAVLLLVLGGGGGATWYVQARQARAAEVHALLDTAESALEIAEDSASDRHHLQARDALDQATTIVAEGVEGAAGRLQALYRRWERLDHSRELVAALEAVRAGHDDPHQIERGYREAFREHGLDADSHPPPTFAAGVAGRAARLEVAAALDDWSRTRRARGGAGGGLVALARALDPDPWRDRLRELGSKPADAIAGELIALSADPAALQAQPAVGDVLLAELLAAAGQSERSLDVLEAAWHEHPDDYWVNLNLGLSSYSPDSGRFARPDQAARHLAVAVATRPESHSARDRLGDVQMARGESEAAEASYRAAEALAPEEARGGD